MHHYNFGSEIAAGGFGKVSKATRVEDGLECVIKQLNSSNEDDKRRFMREVRLLVQMSHRHIVTVLGMNLDDDPPWFAMPKAISNLRQHVETTKPDEANRLKLFRDALEGVAYAHSNGIVHRDLKPENILIYDDLFYEFACVADFGLGRRVVRDTTVLTQTQCFIGTQIYAAPEQLLDTQNAVEQADVYALGKILYELLTDTLPHAIRLDKLQPRLRYLVEKATKPDANDRFPNAAEFLSELDVCTRAVRPDNPLEKANEFRMKAMLSQFRQKEVSEFASYLLQNVDDYQILATFIPRLEQAFINQLGTYTPDALRALVLAFDSRVAAEVVSFDYCDTIAEFYKRIVQSPAVPVDVKATCLKRLPELGFSKNRWHVGKVLAQLLNGMTDEYLILVVRDALQKNQSAALWCSQYLKVVALPPEIRVVLELAAL